jgi:hypothetical protein
MRRRKSLAEFFWARVQKSGACWTWTGRFDGAGYGTIQLGRGEKQIGAHRASWMLHYGQIVNGLFVCHHCDNRSCVRPDHLFLGTQKDNLQDASRKGRMDVPGKGWLGTRTHCPRGHEFDEKNTKVHNGVRLCRPCRAENQIQYKRRKRANAVHSC